MMMTHVSITQYTDDYSVRKRVKQQDLRSDCRELLNETHEKFDDVILVFVFVRFKSGTTGTGDGTCAITGRSERIDFLPKKHQPGEIDRDVEDALLEMCEIVLKIRQFECHFEKNNLLSSAKLHE